jgi:tetratricopeptide (TPR) repeat protein
LFESDSILSGLSVNEFNIGNVSEGGIASSVALSGHSPSELPFNSVEPNNVNHRDISSLTTQLSVPTFPPAKLFWHDIIRDVYKRACVVHCPRKPTIRLQWAAFEEEIGNLVGARQLIQHCIDWFPNLLDSKSQMIELERRCGNHDLVVKLLENYLKKPANTNEFSTLSIKYARFLYKEQGKPDKALAVLRKAVKKDKGNHLLYSYVFEICHERFPTDRKGAAAALELAIQAKEIMNEYKLQFIKKKCLFLQEHGDLAKYRDALDQLYEMQEIVAAEQAKANANAAEEKRAHSQPQPHPQVFHPPIWNPQEYVPISYEPVDDVGPQNQNSSSNQESEGPYKAVPPTEELWQNSSAYGYHNHPDSKLQDTLSHREYDTLVSRGYPDKRDPDKSSSSIPKGRKRRRRDVPVFIVPPKGPYLADYLAKARTTNN